MDVAEENKETKKPQEAGLMFRTSSSERVATGRRTSSGSGQRPCRSHVQTIADCEDEARIRLDERGRLARELHDSTSQLLVALELQFMRLKHMSSAPKSKDFDQVLAELRSTVAELHEEVRAVGTSGHNPDALSRDLVEMAAEFSVRTGVTVRTEIDPLSASITPEVAHALYRIAQEALANVSRHAEASNVSLSLSGNPDVIAMRIADDGVGFRTAVHWAGGGHGIANMRARLEEVGGDLTIENLTRGALVAATIDLAL